jgi:hypothetical protein
VIQTVPGGAKGGTRVPYADRHQLGLLASTLKGRDTPVRKIISDWNDWPDAWKNRVLGKMHEGIGRFLEAMSRL